MAMKDEWPVQRICENFPLFLDYSPCNNISNWTVCSLRYSPSTRHLEGYELILSHLQANFAILKFPTPENQIYEVKQSRGDVSLMEEGGSESWLG